MKKLSIIIILITSIILITVFFSINKNSSDALKFKEEYESLNSNDDERVVNVSIPKNNPIVYVTYEELIDILKNKSGIVYFGFSACPWCRNMIPILIDVALENNQEIYYFNPRNIRENNGEEYKNLISILSNYLTENSAGELTLYVPDVYFIKNGVIVGNWLSTLDSQDDPYIELNDEQKSELASIYRALLEKTR